jgi:hypothetical protein
LPTHDLGLATITAGCLPRLIALAPPQGVQAYGEGI